MIEQAGKNPRLFCGRIAAAKAGDSAFITDTEVLTAIERKIVAEFLAVQRQPAGGGGYYKPDNAKADASLRPSATLNGILAGV